MKRKVLLTGATGTMGRAAMKELLARRDEFELTVLARDSRKNRRMLGSGLAGGDFRVVYGDLCNPADVRRAVGQCDVVLHVGGMVSPMADRYPELTMKVNVAAARNIVGAVRECGQEESTAVVYIGSVAQTGMRFPPRHWARTGDPLLPSAGDVYARSKIHAEKIIAEGGMRRWVSLRLGSILSPGILNKGTDPITFHVPMEGVLEWTSDADCGRLLAGVCSPDIPDEFWGRFYNIGGGGDYRLTYHEVYTKMLATLGCPPPERSFDARWFARRNFHGAWFADSDLLESLVPFRGGVNCGEWFAELRRRLPPYMRLTPIVPALVIRAVMRRVASSRPLGPVSWFKTGDRERIQAFFGNVDDWRKLPRWKDMDLARPETPISRLDHGFDEEKPLARLDIGDMRRAAGFRGGRCLSPSMERGAMDVPLEWECHCGHRFHASPAVVLLGGHWCPECLDGNESYLSMAEKSPFIGQLYR